MAASRSKQRKPAAPDFTMDEPKSGKARETVRYLCMDVFIALNKAFHQPIKEARDREDADTQVEFNEIYWKMSIHLYGGPTPPHNVSFGPVRNVEARRQALNLALIVCLEKLKEQTEIVIAEFADPEDALLRLHRLAGLTKFVTDLAQDC